jgi:hypothetical protein
VTAFLALSEAWAILHISNTSPTLPSSWVAEAAVVARPFELRRLPFGGYAFLSELSKGKTVATAAEIATAVSPKFDVASNLALLDDAKVVVGIHEAA